MAQCEAMRAMHRLAYAGGNLAVMSRRAHRAEREYGTDDALRFVQQIELDKLGRIDG